jgi:AcrR family transcriptional regulator
VPPRGRRPEGGPDTRAAILAAARELFADRGFDRTTMREIGARAGVDPALIHHYFGTKDRLLVESLAMPVDADAVLGVLVADPQHAGAEVVRRIVGVWEADAGTRERLLGLFRVGVAHERGAAALRDLLGRTVLAALEHVAAADHQGLRAALVGTQMGGLFLGRYVLQVPAVRDATADELAAAMGPAIQHYLTGDMTTADRPRRRSRAR